MSVITVIQHGNPNQADEQIVQNPNVGLRVCRLLEKKSPVSAGSTSPRWISGVHDLPLARSGSRSQRTPETNRHGELKAANKNMWFKYILY